MTPPTVNIAADDLRWLLDSMPLDPLDAEGAARYWRLHDLADEALAEPDAEEEKSS